MPLVPSVMKKQMEAAIFAGLTREFKEEIAQNPEATKGHKKLASAISDIAMVIIEQFLSSAEVAPGIATAGSPASQTSVSPGKIM